MKYRFVGLSLGAATHLGRYLHPLRQMVHGLEPMDFGALCTDMAEIEDDEYPDWPSWFSRVRELNPNACGPEGWGACYGAGLSPESAIDCCASGIYRDAVERYWSIPPKHMYKLTFDLAIN